MIHNSFNLQDKLRAFSKKTKKAQKVLRERFIESIKEALEEMVRVAKEKTPHAGDGKKRGFNVITNSLQDSWRAEFEEGGKRNVGTVTLTNEKPYAKFVQEGHRVSKHFVPWLYKDGDGTLSYNVTHSGKLFGLMVGTKTTHVDGVDMVGPALEAFNDKLEELNEELIKELNK